MIDNGDEENNAPIEEIGDEGADNNPNKIVDHEEDSEVKTNRSDGSDTELTEISDDEEDGENEANTRIAGNMRLRPRRRRRRRQRPRLRRRWSMRIPSGWSFSSSSIARLMAGLSMKKAPRGIYKTY